MYNGYRSIFNLPKHAYDEMVHFFSVYKMLEHKQTAVDEIGDRDEAEAIVASCIKNYNEHFVKEI